MPDAVTHTAPLPLARATVQHVAALLAAHQRAIGTRKGRGAPGPFAQAVIFLRWTLDATKVARLAGDNDIGRSTAHRYIDEATDVIAAQAPDLREVLDDARAAGHRHLMIDGRADRHRPIPRDRPHQRGGPGVPPLAGAGGQESTTTTAPASRSSPPPTAGPSTPPRCAREESTTPPPRAPTKDCWTPWTPGRARGARCWPTWATTESATGWSCGGNHTTPRDAAAPSRGGAWYAPAVSRWVALGQQRPRQRPPGIAGATAVLTNHGTNPPATTRRTRPGSSRPVRWCPGADGHPSARATAARGPGEDSGNLRPAVSRNDSHHEHRAGHVSHTRGGRHLLHIHELEDPTSAPGGPRPVVRAARTQPDRFHGRWPSWSAPFLAPRARSAPFTRR